ncbi:MAG: AbrB/MazE/SpoVT family DNA-binding domain-containing protein [Eubacteriales bacterium]|jgi:AbrB family looped-hinge helix DNA binding protein|nr:AbrB/MazE/SpoVT family DNA-binding domain-containing protein [Bacillota bacterium]MBV1728367.1 AbrB/MazE/SpoVT family DNA-binding domain-containing protein [Desulforudis sp.]MDP3049802.1 AbrB/MazE/SpoVT family DNA-binding domain-containing protein [Eubacteriales bacterium]MBU4533510.1 AbrB/MazE/SpoVT family DNA-binding domain-containing protein [Bacillota bacterium]MBU4555152.1 AbrB/MazE/SpoVT family DNA-binding domain-containing protein [Bacillota bacterium]
MSEVRVSSKYQIVIPRDARRILKIEKGQRLQVLVQNGAITLIPEKPLSEMRGFLRRMDTTIERDEDERL